MEKSDLKTVRAEEGKEGWECVEKEWGCVGTCGKEQWGRGVKRSRGKAWGSSTLLLAFMTRQSAALTVRRRTWRGFGL